MRNCDYYEELISRSLDDELSVEERRELAVHLASCPSCSQMRQLMADISGLMEEDMEELPGGLHEDIMAAVRRSEMIKKNGGSARAAKTGRHGRNINNIKPVKIPRYVRNLLATAACMALVITAAVSLNPGEKAESVVMSRTAPMAAADTVQQDTAAAAPESSPQTAPTQQPSPSPNTQPDTGASAGTQVAVQSGNSGTIVTTPTPTSDPYMGWRIPANPETTVTPDNSGSAQGTIINPATPSPLPVVTPEPSPVSLPTPTPTPAEITQPGSDEQVGAVAESQEAVNSSIEASESSIQAQEPAIGSQADGNVEVHKTAPVRVFSLFPSLAELSPTETPDVGSEDGSTEIAPASGENSAGEAPIASPAPTPCPDPVEMDLMDKEKCGDILLLLMGLLDESGTDPKKVTLPEGECDRGYIISLVYDEIPCEAAVFVYGEDVYFSLAEIVVEPSQENAPADVQPQLPAPETGSLENATDIGGQDSQSTLPGAEEDFKPIWFLSGCTGTQLSDLLDSFAKQ